MDDFFPEKVPVQGKQKEYFYAKQKVLDMKAFRDSRLSESGGVGTIISTLQPENVTIVFEYDNASRRVSYRAFTNQSL